MSNYYHLVIEIPNGNLSKGLMILNGEYTLTPCWDLYRDLTKDWFLLE